MEKRSAAHLQDMHRMKLFLTQWRVIKPDRAEDFGFPASSAPWNACPVKCGAYFTGAEPIPLGSADSLLVNIVPFPMPASSLTISDFVSVMVRYYPPLTFLLVPAHQSL